MHKFIANHQDEISGVLSGFDRLVFRGTLRSITYAAGIFAEVPVRVEYRLTDKGAALAPIYEAIGGWATRWIDGIEAPPGCHDQPSVVAARDSAQAERGQQA